VLGGAGSRATAASWSDRASRDRYIADLPAGVKLTRPLKVIAACGNGTAGAFAPDALRAMGGRGHRDGCDLDWTFPKYNPNPKTMKCCMPWRRR
jgi:phosphomannomutase/phosphoglucomutase